MSSSIDRKSIISKNNIFSSNAKHTDNELSRGLSTSTTTSSSTDSSSDDEDFYDAPEIPDSDLTSVQQSISNVNTQQNTEQLYKITLNQSQMNDLQRRDKLSFLRSQEEKGDLSYSQIPNLFQQTNVQKSIYSPSLDTSTVGIYDRETEQHQSLEEKYPPDLLKDHISNTDRKRKKKQAPSVLRQNDISFSQQSPSQSYHMSRAKTWPSNVESNNHSQNDLSSDFSPRSPTLSITSNPLIDEQYQQHHQHKNCCPNCFASFPSPSSQQPSRFDNYSASTNHRTSSFSSSSDTVPVIFLPRSVLDNIHQNTTPSFQQQHSLPVSSPTCTTFPYSNRNHRTPTIFDPRKLTAISEPVNLDTIDCITKFGGLTRGGQTLNDDEIMKQPIVKNLDYGKYVPLQEAVPKEFMNPMTMQILKTVNASANSSSTSMNNSLRRNSTPNDYHHNYSPTVIKNETHSTRASNDELDSISTSSEASTKSSHTTAASTSTTKASQTAVKNLLKGTNGDSEHEEFDDESDDDKDIVLNDSDVKYKSSRNLTGHSIFDKTQLLQTIVTAHNGPIWCMRFSPDGRLLATGGQDTLLKVWMFKTMHTTLDEYSDVTTESKSKESQAADALAQRFHEFDITNRTTTSDTTANPMLGLNENQAPLYPKPFCELTGHLAAVLDIAWSKSHFMLSSSMDKTVRLWHLSRKECLCFFRHIDFVSAIAFHPRDDRYFVSASLDGHVRLWHIPDKKVIYWNQIQAQTNPTSSTNANLITAINFCDDGKKVIVGTFDGRFIVYTDSLVYDTVMNIGDKNNNRSRKKRRKPRKITGIEAMNLNSSKILITSNDSRIRLYDIKTKEIERKYRGYSNNSSQIRASFSHDDRYIISGSEDSWFYIWQTVPVDDVSINNKYSKLSKKQRRHFDRAWERIR
ncbi:unnamed protein product, partial [Didymodactylos carnosus]